MKNTYQNSFEINLGHHFILPSLSLGLEPIPKLLNLQEVELRNLIYSGLVDIFSKYTITSDNEESTISVDWGNLLDNREDSNVLSIDIKLNTDRDINPNARKHYLSYYIEVFFYELFMIFNLSIPGSISLFQTYFVDNKCKTKFTIGNSCFSNSLEWSNKIGWPKIAYIPIKDVATWYKSLNIGIRQISKNDLERVIFSLLHVCSDELSSPSGLIWLAHSLESLFESPKSSIATTMIKRAFKILGEPEENSKMIRKMFLHFYDLRSRYVHGEFNIHHPSFNNILDDSIDDYYDQITPSYSIGFSIVLACLQILILNNWKGFKFLEEFEGINCLIVNNEIVNL